MTKPGARFWQKKTLDEMTAAEWEKLCDRCGLCCLVRLENEDTGEIHATSIVCSQYDCGNKRCRSYADRSKVIEDCTQLTPKLVREFSWLPKSCAYRLIDAGKPLPDSHPLVSNSSETTTTVAEHIAPLKLINNHVDIDPQDYLIDKL